MNRVTKILLIIFLFSNIVYSWNSNGSPVCDVVPGLHLFPKAVPDGNGGIISCFEDMRSRGSISTGYEVYAQRLNANGTQLWDTNGVVVSYPYTPLGIKKHGHRLNSVMCAGDSGAAIICWVNYHDLSLQQGDSAGIYIQKVADGQIKWAGRPVKITTASTNPPSICSDDSGGCVVAWLESPTNNNPNYYVKVTRLSASGYSVWTDIIRSGTTFVRNVKIVWAGTGAFVFWWDYVSDNTSPKFVYRYVDQDGTPSPEVITIDEFTNTYGQLLRDYAVCPSENDHACVAWVQETYETGDPPIYHKITSATLKCAKLDRTGIVWTNQNIDSNSDPVDKLSPNIESPKIAYDGSSVCVTWAKKSTSFKIYACVLAASNGSQHWDSLISNSAYCEKNPKVVAKSDSEFIVVWQKFSSDSTTTKYCWSRVTDSEAFGGSEFGYSGYYNGNFDVVSTPSGAITTWAANYPAGDWNIYAQKINY